MLTSSFLFTAGYGVMGEWLKQHIVAIVLASITGIGTFTAGQVTNEVRLTGMEDDIVQIRTKQKASEDKYVPMLEKHDDDIRMLKSDYTDLAQMTASAVTLARQNAGNITILLEDRKILTGMSSNVQELTVDVSVMKNEVTHIKERVDTLK